MPEPCPLPTQTDQLIDDLLRLQARHAALIWRLKECAGVEIEFFLEELAIDCATALNRAGIPAQHLPDQPRGVRLPPDSIAAGQHTQIIRELAAFLQAQRQTYIDSHKEQTA